LERGIASNGGVVGRAFLQRYLAKHGKNLNLVGKLMSKFYEAAEVPADNWERLFASGFALAFAAVMLARRFGLVPWQKALILDAIRGTYRDARQVVQHEPERTAAAVELVKRKLLSSKHLVDVRSRSTKLGKAQRKRAARYGYIRSHDGQTELLLRPRALRRWVGTSARPELVVDALRNSGALIPDQKGLMTTQVHVAVDPKRARYYRIIRKRL
jgi:hypothetical protein